MVKGGNVPVNPERMLAELGAIPMFRRLSDVGLQRLARIARARIEPAATLLFRQGEAGSELLVLVHGSLSVTRRSVPEAPDLCVAVLTDGQVLGELAILDGHPRSATVTTLEDCTLIALERAPFLALLRREPDIALLLLECLALRLRETTEQLGEIAQLDLFGRVVHQIARLAAEHGTECEQGVVVEHPITVATLATMVAARLEPVERIVGMLESDGLLTWRDQHLLVHDPAQLAARPTPLMY